MRPGGRAAGVSAGPLLRRRSLGAAGEGERGREGRQPCARARCAEPWRGRWGGCREPLSVRLRVAVREIVLLTPRGLGEAAPGTERRARAGRASLRVRLRPSRVRGAPVCVRRGGARTNAGAAWLGLARCRHPGCRVRAAAVLPACAQLSLALKVFTKNQKSGPEAFVNSRAAPGELFLKYRCVRVRFCSVKPCFRCAGLRIPRLRPCGERRRLAGSERGRAHRPAPVPGPPEGTRLPPPVSGEKPGWSFAPGKLERVCAGALSH